MAEKQEQEEKKEGDAPKKGGKKLVIIIAAAVLVLGGAGAFFMMGSSPEEEEQPMEEIEEGHDEAHTEAIEIGTFLVNLSENATFLKATVVMEVNSHLLHHEPKGGSGGGGHGGGEEGDSKLPGILGAKEASIKDRIIKILSSKRAQQLLDADGKEELKEELVDAINQLVELDEELVSNVFFTNFIIQ